MKTLILFFAALLVTTPMFAQTVPHTTMKEGVMKRSGKTWIITKMTENTTLGNGIQVMLDGTITTKAGKVITLDNGDAFNYSGVLVGFNEKVDWMIVKNHVMWVYTLVDQTVSLADGSSIDADGTLVRENRKNVKLAEGNFISIDGMTATSTVLKF